MARKISRYEIVCDTSMFSAQQLQIRFCGQVGMNGWARWLREHAVPFRELIAKQRLGVVVVGASIEHLRPLTFFDSAALEIEVAVDVIDSGMLRCTSDVYADGALCVRTWCALRPVKINALDGTLSGAPASIEGKLLEYFTPDNYLPDWRSPRPTQDWMRRLAQEAQPLAEHQESRVVGRKDCEAADQWSFIEVPEFGATSREHMARARMSDVNKLQDGLSRTLKALFWEMRRPLFIFDRFNVNSRAYEVDGGLVCAHTLAGETADRTPNATVVEVFNT